MKKMTYVLIAVSVFVIGMMAVSWAQMTAPQAAPPATPQAVPTATTVTTAPVAAAPTTAPAAPKAPTSPVAAVQAPVAPAVTPPVAPGVKPVGTVPTKPALPKGMEAATEPKAATPAKDDKAGAPTDLRNAMQSGEFLTKLSFKLTEAQMIEFARAAIKVSKINSKWDVQIASVEADQMAIEYSNLAVEEIEYALKSIPGLTLAQYNEMTSLTIADKEFASIYLAYKQLVSEGAFGEVPKAGALPVAKNDLGPAESSAAKYGTSVSPVIPNSNGGKPVSNSGAALPDAPVKPAAIPAKP